MYIRSPRLEIYPDRIATNARSVISLCHDHGAQVAAVTKVTAAHPAVVHALELGGADMIADSRISNLQSMANTGLDLPLMLLRIPAPSRAADVVRCAHITLNSSLQAIQLLSEAAQFSGVRPQGIVVVDAGHGGQDGGAVANGVDEKNSSLAVADGLEAAPQRRQVELQREHHRGQGDDRGGEHQPSR